MQPNGDIPAEYSKNLKAGWCGGEEEGAAACWYLMDGEKSIKCKLPKWERVNKILKHDKAISV